MFLVWFHWFAFWFFVVWFWGCFFFVFSMCFSFKMDLIDLFQYFQWTATLSYSLAVRLAFLSPDMSVLRIRKWSDIQYILTEFFQAWTIDLQRKQLAEDFMSWYIEIIHIRPILSDFKSVYLEFKGHFFSVPYTLSRNALQSPTYILDPPLESLSDLLCLPQTALFLSL